MTRTTALFAFGLAPTLGLALLAGCGSETGPGNPVPEAQTTTDVAGADQDLRELVAQDFDLEVLGARVEGPEGDSVNSSLSGPAAAFADLESYVACPQGSLTCVPGEEPAETLFTYVNVVTPGELTENDVGETEDSVNTVRTVARFRIDGSLNGFTGEAGYSLGQARAAIGNDGRFTVTCRDGELVFTKVGGGDWEQGQPITFFWRSSVPPAGPSEGYAFDADGMTARGSGPLPPAGEPLPIAGC